MGQEAQQHLWDHLFHEEKKNIYNSILYLYGIPEMS